MGKPQNQKRVRKKRMMMHLITRNICPNQVVAAEVEKTLIIRSMRITPNTLTVVVAEAASMMLNIFQKLTLLQLPQPATKPQREKTWEKNIKNNTRGTTLMIRT